MGTQVVSLFGRSRDVRLSLVEGFWDGSRSLVRASISLSPSLLVGGGSVETSPLDLPALCSLFKHVFFYAMVVAYIPFFFP